MGRTVPSFRTVITEEKQEWKPFRNALDKSERKEFDEMWDIPRLYVSACSNSVQFVPFHPIAMSILFHHYKELIECEKQIKLMDNNNNNNNSIGINDLQEELQNEMEIEEDRKIEQEQQLTLFDFKAIRQ
jgi:hypothetical protein